MVKKSTDKKELIKTIAKGILTLTGIKAKLGVEDDPENEAVVLDIEAGEETGLLIGRHGETLQALQTVIGLAARQKLGEWARVIVNVGDWRQKEEDRLSSLALAAAARAKETGQPQPLYNLSAAQRRVVHLTLSSDPEIETASQGEGVERYLVVKPK